MKGKGYSDEFKQQVLKEADETGNITLVARNNNIPWTTVYTWIKMRKNSGRSSSTQVPETSRFNFNNCG